MRDKKMSRSFFWGLTALAAGMIIGMLTAPKTGRASRAWLRQKLDHWRAQAYKTAGRLGSQARYEEGRLAGVAHKMRQLALVPEKEEEEAFIDDDLITQRVRTRIGEDRRTWRLPRINVDTADFIVTLRGRVQTEEERQALDKVASSVPDVQGVVNKITIASKRAAS